MSKTRCAVPALCTKCSETATEARHRRRCVSYSATGISPAASSGFPRSPTSAKRSRPSRPVPCRAWRLHSSQACGRPTSAEPSDFRFRLCASVQMHRTVEGGWEMRFHDLDVGCGTSDFEPFLGQVRTVEPADPFERPVLIVEVQLLLEPFLLEDRIVAQIVEQRSRAQLVKRKIADFAVDRPWSWTARHPLQQCLMQRT